MAWLAPEYEYRKKITLTGQSGAGIGYPVKLIIGESSGASGDDFHLEGHSESFPTTNDEFRDEYIDPKKWTEDITSGYEDYFTIAEQNNRLEFASSSIPSGEGHALIDSSNKWYLEGDFDVRIDYEILNSSDSDFWWAQMLVFNDLQTEGFSIRRGYRTGDGNVYDSNDLHNGVWGAGSFSGTSDTSGQIRLVRTGTTCKSYYYNSGWQELRSATIDTDNVYLYLDLFVGNNRPDTNVAFTNFEVYSGTVLYANQSGDLTFTDDDQLTELDFWVEKIEGTSPNRKATIWVKVDDNLDSNQDIYCYYGRQNPSNISNGDNTFSLFDNFNDDSLNSSKWSTEIISGSASNFTLEETNKRLELSESGLSSGEALATVKSEGKVALSGDFSVEYDFGLLNVQNQDFWWVELMTSSADYQEQLLIKRGYDSANSNNFHANHNTGGVFQSAVTTSTSAELGKLRIRRIGSTGYMDYYDGSWNTLKSATIGTDDMHVRINIYVGGTNKPDTSVFSDTLIARKYNSTEPSFNSATAEEVSTELISDIVNDFRLSGAVLEDVTNDFRMAGVIERIDIENDFRTRLEVINDIDNDFRTVYQALEDVSNKFNSAIEVISDIDNVFAMVKGVVEDINNDFRTNARTISDIQNDIRFLAPGANPTLPQSKGKEYVKVYINSVEQTDVDVDSVVINKGLNGAFNASLTLGRAYDSTAPNDRESVEIKYNNYTVFKGYVVEVTPGNNPESITVFCLNEYWQINKNKKYFLVGHEPDDAREKYYTTIKNALDALGTNFNIGNFIPQTMDLTGVGTADAISELVQNSGNFGWFIDENYNKRLWRAGSGNIISLNEQEIGKNLKLYDVIRHDIRQSALDIVNKLRVNMGAKVIRRDSLNSQDGSGENSYTRTQTFYTVVDAIPNWNSDLEVLSFDSSDGYGFDWQDPSKDYRDVFRKFELPGLSSRYESWSDILPPIVKISEGHPFLNQKVYYTKDGFTLDYQSVINYSVAGFPYYKIAPAIIFSEPQLYYEVNENNEVINIRRKNVRVYIAKERKITYSNPEGSKLTDPDTEPEESELTFYTSKVGSYPETIIDSLELSNLSIQEGYTVTDPDTGNIITVPSWDDTDFAEDLAYWELSKTHYEKISGTVEITLDALIYYNIDLSKRIKIEGLLEPVNITSISYNFSNFTATLNIENAKYYKRSEDYPYHGE